jgi:hypothetical protein
MLEWTTMSIKDAFYHLKVSFVRQLGGIAELYIEANQYNYSCATNSTAGLRELT